MDKKCSGECIKCSFQQQIYCAAQHGHAIMSVFSVLNQVIGKTRNRCEKCDARRY